MTDILGSFSFVLHSHLPWVLNHGVWPHGTSWVNEAAAETYIPLLMELYKLVDDGYHPRLTIGLTPVLCEMLRHPSFVDGFQGYFDEKTVAATHENKDFLENKVEESRIKLTTWWLDLY